MNREREHPIDRIENIMLKTKLGTKIRDKIASVLVGLIIKKYTKKGKKVNIMFNELNNTKRTVREGINTDNMEFQPLKNFVGNTINVDGFFFTNSKYGKQVVVVGNGALINMPKRALEQFESISNNDEMLKAVLDGKLIIKDVAPITTKNGDSVSYTLADR